MKLLLSRLPITTRGIYTVAGVPGLMFPRALAMHPVAARGFEALERATGGLVYSDILRSLEESLHAVQTKKGVQPPGYSGHNFGFSVDVAVELTLKRLATDYSSFLHLMAGLGWHCHRRDGLEGSESWHFTYFGERSAYYLVRADPRRPATWAAPVEQLIEDTYAPQFFLTAVEVQRALASLRLYHGDIDGDIGPLSRVALGAFQRAWGLHETGYDDTATQRVLAVATSTVEWV